LQRYEAAQEGYPATFAALNKGEGMKASTTGLPDIQALVSSGELKQNFESAAGTALGKIWIYKDATYGKPLVCYKPTAKAFILSAGLFTNAGDLAALGKNAPSNPNALVKCENMVSAETNCSLNGTIPGDRDCCVYCAQ
jgi:hypothetical protein